MIAFGPVPSCGLGQSLGIKNIQPKICSYACVYCQLGRTLKMRIERQTYYQPQLLFQEVRQKVEQVKKVEQRIYYLTFVLDGEPTLDIHLWGEIGLLKDLSIQIADYLASVKPSMAYIAIPTRPPAESYAVSPAEEKINQDFHIFKQKIPQVELLIGYEGSDFAFTGNVEDDLLSITAVHLMRADAVDSFLKRSGSDWSVVRQMIQREKLLETTFEGNKFYLRKLDRHKKKN